MSLFLRHGCLLFMAQTQSLKQQSLTYLKMLFFPWSFQLLRWLRQSWAHTCLQQPEKSFDSAAAADAEHCHLWALKNTEMFCRLWFVRLQIYSTLLPPSFMLLLLSKLPPHHYKDDQTFASVSATAQRRGGGLRCWSFCPIFMSGCLH